MHCCFDVAVNRSAKVKLGVAAVAAVAVAGGGGAIAATRIFSPDQERQAVIDDAAKQLGVTPTELSDALTQALKNRVDDAVQAGRLTKEEGDALKERIDSGRTPFFFGGLGFPKHGLDHVGPFGSFDAAASYLGLTEAEVRARLFAGNTLAEIAKNRGKSVDGLVQALVKAASDRIDAAVDAGKITKSQADKSKADLRDAVTDLVNGEHRFSFRGPRFDSRGPGFRHRFGGFGEDAWRFRRPSG
jgi:polyhydroxyalkanoate synthesis regulator phasin